MIVKEEKQRGLSLFVVCDLLACGNVEVYCPPIVAIEEETVTEFLATVDTLGVVSRVITEVTVDLVVGIREEEECLFVTGME